MKLAAQFLVKAVVISGLYYCNAPTILHPSYMHDYTSTNDSVCVDIETPHAAYGLYYFTQDLCAVTFELTLKSLMFFM